MSTLSKPLFEKKKVNKNKQVFFEGKIEKRNLKLSFAPRTTNID
jgi:hypothetical protein